MCSPSEMSSTSISSSDSAILNAQQKTGPRGMGVGIVRGDLGLDLGRDRARIEQLIGQFNKTCKSVAIVLESENNSYTCKVHV